MLEAIGVQNQQVQIKQAWQVKQHHILTMSISDIGNSESLCIVDNICQSTVKANKIHGGEWRIAHHFHKMAQLKYQ